MSEPARWERQFSKNPAAWVLGALFVLSVFFHYRTGAQFTRVCGVVSSLADGYVDIESNQRFTPSGINISAIMLEAQKADALLKADTAEGRLRLNFQVQHLEPGRVLGWANTIGI